MLKEIKEDIKEGDVNKENFEENFEEKEIPDNFRTEKSSFRPEDRTTLIKLLNIYSIISKTRKGKLLNWKLYM